MGNKFAGTVSEFKGQQASREFSTSNLVHSNVRALNVCNGYRNHLQELLTGRVAMDWRLW